MKPRCPRGTHFWGRKNQKSLWPIAKWLMTPKVFTFYVSVERRTEHSVVIGEHLQRAKSFNSCLCPSMLLSGTVPSALKMCTNHRLCQIIIDIILFREKELSCFAEHISTPSNNITSNCCTWNTTWKKWLTTDHSLKQLGKQATEEMMFKEITWQVQAVTKPRTLSLKVSATHLCPRG